MVKISNEKLKPVRNAYPKVITALLVLRSRFIPRITEIKARSILPKTMIVVGSRFGEVLINRVIEIITILTIIPKKIRLLRILFFIIQFWFVNQK